MNCRYHQEANTKKPCMEMNREQCIHLNFSSFFLFFFFNKAWKITSPLLKKKEHKWSKMKQSSRTLDTEWPVCSSHQPIAGKLVRKVQIQVGGKILNVFRIYQQFTSTGQEIKVPDQVAQC